MKITEPQNTPISPSWTLQPVALATLPAPGWECLMGLNEITMRPLTFWIWILRYGDQVGLIDSGLPAGPDLDALNRANQALAPECLFTPITSLPETLKAEGIDPSEIQFLLLSQFITYATGGLCREHFPNAHVYVAYEGMRELLTATPGHPPREFYLTSNSWNYVRELLVEQRISFVSEPVEVAPGLIYEPTGGHHPGSAGIKIRTAHGVVGLLETAFVQENIEKEIPIGIAENAAECRTVIRRYKRECDLVLAGHEPDLPKLLQGWMTRLPGFSRL